MTKPTSRLGRGLNSLIPASPTRHTSPPLPHHISDPNQIRQVPTDAISPNPHQPRSSFDDQSLAELSASIRANGLLQPIIVRTTDGESYEIVAGERRWRAAVLAGIQTIPAIIRELSDSQSFEIALIENLQRQDLAPLERAAAYKHYLDSFGGTVEDLAARLNESRASISNYMRLLKLSPEICYMLGAGQLGMGQARAIAGVSDPRRQLAIARLAARRNLSVRQVEELVRAADASEPGPPETEHGATSHAQERHIGDIESALSKATGLRVRLIPGRRKNSGRVVIHYNTLVEFDQLAEKLGGDAHLE